jgi:activator of HSP90 ATPase
LILTLHAETFKIQESIKILNMKTKTIKQTVTFNATPEEVYHLLMDEEKHSAFTGTKASVSKEIKGTFTAWDGYISGYNIELVEGKKIVQAWHFTEKGWPDDHYSTCTFLLEPEGNKTKLTFIQTDVPEDSAETLKGGWKDVYWEPMKAYLKGK